MAAFEAFLLAFAKEGSSEAPPLGSGGAGSDARSSSASTPALDSRGEYRSLLAAGGRRRPMVFPSKRRMWDLAVDFGAVED